jgi:F420-0:gamma-glutamyl ligase
MKIDVEVGKDVVVELEVGIRRVDVYGTELMAEEETLGDEIAASCLVVGTRLSVDCEDID